MKLTMKAIIRWELLCKKPFSKLDYDNEDDIISLFYVCSQPNIIESSLSEFKNDLKEDDLKRMIGDFERLTSLSAQFTAEPKKRPKTKETDPNEIKEPEPAYIKEIVPMLVMNGLDADFALNEMELYD